MRETFDQQVRAWWKYIDTIILYELPIPLPRDMKPSFTLGNDNEPVQITHNVQLYDWARNRERFMISVLKKFLIPDDDLISIDEMCGYTNKDDKTYICDVIGHEKEMDLFDDTMDKVHKAAYDYVIKLTETFPELSTENALLRSLRQETEDSEAYQIDRHISEDKTLDKLRSRFGNFSTYNIRFGDTGDELMDLYDALEIREFDARRQLYEDGPVKYCREIMHKTDVSSDLYNLIEEYKQIYAIYYEFLQKYVEIMRPLIHNRLYHYQLRYVIMNEHDNLFNGLEKLYSDERADTLTGNSISYESRESVCKNINEAIAILKDPNKDQMVIYYPWDVTLVKLQLDTNGGNDNYECNHQQILYYIPRIIYRKRCFKTDQ